MSKLSEIKVEKYKKTQWKDNLVEYPNVFKSEEIDNGMIVLDKYEGEVYQSGTPVEEVIMNNIEDGILNNNKYILATIDDVKDLQLKVLILQASLTGNVNGDVFVDNLDDLDSIVLNRGIYDSNEKSIYCVDKNGNKIEINGYAIAIG